MPVRHAPQDGTGGTPEFWIYSLTVTGIVFRAAGHEGSALLAELLAASLVLLTQRK